MNEGEWNMTVNSSSVLSVEYFEAYLQLVSTSKEVGWEEAGEYMKEHFFRGDSQLYGQQTARNFLLACKSKRGVYLQIANK